MNNAKIWLVVKPTVGIPLFLSAVAIGSFVVHYMVVTNTPFYFNFVGGKTLKGASLEQPNTVALADGKTATIAFSDKVQ
jgi:light-harvesting protein B-800-850 alpha chain